MTATAFDYDASDIPDGYDRARDHGPDHRDLWMRIVREATNGHRTAAGILDLGCGTGRFSGALGASFDAEVVGVDPSTRMIAHARSKPHGSNVRYVIGRGEAGLGRLRVHSGVVDPAAVREPIDTFVFG